jgi:hypothetical protein
MDFTFALTFGVVELFELTMSCAKKQQAIRHAGRDPASRKHENHGFLLDLIQDPPE